MKKFDVLVVGELNVDIILDDIIGFPEIGKEILSNKLTVTLGSSSAIFASNLSTLGANVAFVGKIGNDSHADLVKASLRTKNVNIDHIITSEKHSTGLTVVMNYDNDRANVTFPGAMNHLKATDISEEIIANAKHLHISSIFMQPSLREGLVELLQKAKSYGLTTSLDPQWDPSEKWDLPLEKVLPLIDIFLPNSKEFVLMTKSKTVEEAINLVKSYSNTIVIKDGISGAHLWTKDKMVSKPAFINNDVADAIGAGDSFDAGFISRFIKGDSSLSCLEFGNLAGAVNTTRRGGTTAFESFNGFKDIANHTFSVKI